MASTPRSRRPFALAVGVFGAGVALAVVMWRSSLPHVTKHAASELPSSTVPHSPKSENWFEDSPEPAFAAARRQKQLVFVDLWAPWCHTCLSMRQQVLSEREVPALSGLVRLAIDTEREQNEHFLQRYPVAVWPTFYVIDPENGEVRGRWLGAASSRELGRWLHDVTSVRDTARELRAKADALAAEKRFARAEQVYRAALAAAPEDSAPEGDALVALISTLRKQHKYADCLELAATRAAQLQPSSSAVDFASVALGCADEAPAGASVSQARQALQAVLANNCSARAPGASADDQADACGHLRRARVALADESGARQAAEQALAVIEAASANAPPAAQAIYDWERSSNLAYLGRASEAIALLREREEALPESYNAPHYLARLYRDLGQWALGLAAIERAIAKAYGPRRVGLLSVKADLLRGAGRVAEAKRTLEEQLFQYRALPQGQKQLESEAAVEERLRALQ